MANKKHHEEPYTVRQALKLSTLLIDVEIDFAIKQYGRRSSYYRELMLAKKTIEEISKMSAYETERQQACEEIFGKDFLPCKVGKMKFSKEQLQNLKVQPGIDETGKVVLKSNLKPDQKPAPDQKPPPVATNYFGLDAMDKQHAASSEAKKSANKRLDNAIGTLFDYDFNYDAVVQKLEAEKDFRERLAQALVDEFFHEN